MSIRVLDPTAEEGGAQAQRNARLASLEGRRIGLLDNGKIRVFELLNHIEHILRTQHGVADVLRFKKPDASRPAPAEVVDDMKQCDAIISAVGDWGSCSSCSLHDAITAEKAGITATAIITDRFVETAETMARVTGMSDYPFVVISHPIANNDDATLRKKAEAVVEQCSGILVQD